MHIFQMPYKRDTHWANVCNENEPNRDMGDMGDLGASMQRRAFLLGNARKKTRNLMGKVENLFCA